jgi:hypothetical protein
VEGLVMNMIPSGFYKHYKGGLYYAFSTGKHSETTEDMVAYYSLYYRTWWFRPANMWDDVVRLDITDGYTEGYAPGYTIVTMRRFRRITLWQAVKYYFSHLCK